MAENNDIRQDGATKEFDAILGERKNGSVPPARPAAASDAPRATPRTTTERAPVRRPVREGAMPQQRAPQGQTPAARNYAGQRPTPAQGGAPGQRMTPAQGAASPYSAAGRRIQSADGRMPVRQQSAAPRTAAERPSGIHDADRAALRKTGAIKAVAEREKNKKKKDTDVGGVIVSGILRTVIYLVCVTVIAVVLSIFIINVGNDAYAFVKTDEAIDVEIPEGATREDIAQILYDNGVINYKTAFRIYGSIKHIEEDFVSGTYTVSPAMNYKDLYNAFKPKPVSGTTWITIPEGYTVDEIIALMLDRGIGGTKQDYVDAINNGDFSEFWFVNELETNGYSPDRFYRLEGYLFPDTYEFYNASSAYTVVRKMLKRFDEIYGDKLRERTAEIGWTTDRIVTLASMIEREAGFSYDFRNVSAVFHNRLNYGGGFLYLSSDATAVYAIQHDTGERPKSVTAETMQYESPYNTYTHQGLPPGAISNPGMNALKYALYPAENCNYLYFVSLPSGETLFATNEWEHNQNVERLRQETGN